MTIAENKLIQIREQVQSFLDTGGNVALDPARKRSRDNSDIKRKALFGWWENSRMDLQMATRARYLIGYSNTVTQLRWNDATGCPGIPSSGH